MRALWLLLALLLVAACEVAPAQSSPTVSERVNIGPDTQRELEAVLQKKSDAIRRQDLSGFQATIDLTRAAFRRCWLEAFDEFSRGSIPFGTLGTKIVKLEPYLDGYVRAYVVDDSTSVSRRYFRRSGGSWVLTEPRDEELGGERAKTVDGLELSYWGIDEDIVGLLADEAIATRTFLTQQLRTAAQTSFAVRFYPTRESAQQQVGCRTAGSHLVNDPRDPFLRIFIVALAPSLQQVSDDTRALVRHEGLHWVQDQFIPGISARMDWWLTEGWPDYVANAPRPGTGQLICSGRTPALADLRRGAPQDDPNSPPELASQYYSYAHSMVEYLYAHFGADAYWSFMTAFKATTNPEVVYPQVVKQTADAYYADWLAWAKKKYC